MAALELPQKLYFRIGEAASLLKVKPHVLRFWEKEFKLRSRKSASGQRVFSRTDVERFWAIKQLLHVEGFKIEGARKQLRERGFEVGDSEPSPERRVADAFREGLTAARERLVALSAQLDQRRRHG
jgi:DNA-binding transcriptional MerR regulator